MLLRNSFFLNWLTKRSIFVRISGLVPFLAVTILSGCIGSSDRQLQAYINSVKERPAGRLEPVPKYIVYKPAMYTAFNLRSPLIPFSQVNIQGKPDAKRSKEILEAFPLDSLHFVGTLIEGDKTWALILAPNKVIYRITVGHYMGQNFGKVIEITIKNVKIIESISTGDSWLQRPINLQLDNNLT